MVATNWRTTTTRVSGRVRQQPVGRRRRISSTSAVLDAVEEERRPRPGGGRSVVGAAGWVGPLEQDGKALAASAGRGGARRVGSRTKSAPVVRWAGLGTSPAGRGAADRLGNAAPAPAYSCATREPSSAEHHAARIWMRRCRSLVKTDLDAQVDDALPRSVERPGCGSNACPPRPRTARSCRGNPEDRALGDAGGLGDLPGGDPGPWR